jgi:hypothetical protein
VKTQDDTVKLLADGLIANPKTLFIILCGGCCPTKAQAHARGNPFDSEVRQKAAARLYRIGWRYHNFTALCPKCAKEISK